MKSFIEEARTYASYHQKPITQMTHFIGIPLIIFSIMILFGFLHLIIPGLMHITLALIATVALICYYFYLNWRLALPLMVVFFILLFLANLISRHGPDYSSVLVFIITFVIGWAFQLVGHYIEGKGPAFIENFWQALIAPMYLAAELFFLAGFMPDLKEQIEAKEEEPPL